MPVSTLTPAFTLDDARAAGLRKDQVYALLTAGRIARLGRSVYVRTGTIDPTLAPLAAATALRNTATLCLTSALIHHDLTDQIPFGTDIALPRGQRHPAGFEHVTWHSFDPTTFTIGRETFDAADGLHLATYSAERTIIDSFRLAHHEGPDLAYTALRRWLQRRGSSPASLLQVAASFPKTLSRIRQALEALL
ncbi:transcriptional regulator [Actinocatenispora thailandica]|uniref:Transcriptional regulator n=1 Tax=Actinocatenispora thailandica TaxID=227318 RepID=A0A7R7HXM9_9ACTN|nr:hypothetical protein [Actinocatenispora thailandica]BCJ36352.1 transcriptional regulator [Actinocatenispora thailandica]